MSSIKIILLLYIFSYFPNLLVANYENVKYSFNSEIQSHNYIFLGSVSAKIPPKMFFL